MNINLKSLQPLGTLDVAARVLQAVDDRIDAETAGECCIQTFCNGREQGFCINLALPRGYGYKVLFSGDRVTDSIVVYFGHSQQFDYRINLPKDDDVWSTAIGFAHDEVEMAAEYIIRMLRGKNMIEQMKRQAVEKYGEDWEKRIVFRDGEAVVTNPTEEPDPLDPLIWPLLRIAQNTPKCGKHMSPSGGAILTNGKSEPWYSCWDCHVYNVKAVE